MQAEPYELNGATGCDYCGCRDICGFDPRIAGFRYRQLEKYSLEEAVEKMRFKTGTSGEGQSAGEKGEGVTEGEHSMDRGTKESN